MSLRIPLLQGGDQNMGKDKEDTVQLLTFKIGPSSMFQRPELALPSFKRQALLEEK